MSNARDDLCERRLAVQLACQLPEENARAIRVLDLTRELVTGFMSGRAPRLRLAHDADSKA